MWRVLKEEKEREEKKDEKKKKMEEGASHLVWRLLSLSGQLESDSQRQRKVEI